jgi:hypothetical protein
VINTGRFFLRAMTSCAFSRVLEYAIVLAAFLIGLAAAILFEKGLAALSEHRQPTASKLVGS